MDKYVIKSHDGRYLFTRGWFGGHGWTEKLEDATVFERNLCFFDDIDSGRRWLKRFAPCVKRAFVTITVAEQ